MRKAAAAESTPTCTGVKQLSKMAANSAANDQAAGVTRQPLAGRRRIELYLGLDELPVRHFVCTQIGLEGRTDVLGLVSAERRQLKRNRRHLGLLGREHDGAGKLRQVRAGMIHQHQSDRGAAAFL
jgi:hypothetical protein